MPRHLAIRNADHSVTVATVEDEREFRWGLDRFLDEARALAHFDHPNIVKVKRFLEANGTGYIVMEYVDGEPLSDMLKRKPTLTEAEITEHVMPLTDGLGVIHAKDMLHRDIKPSNIMVRADGAPVLIDFGSARRAVSAKSRDMTAVVTPGYAPYEQYFSSMGNQGPATDIYALGAVLYCCVTGKTPDNALERKEQDTLATVAAAANGSYSEGLLTAIHAALAIRIEDRPCDVAAFQKLVSLDAAAAIDALDRGDYEVALNGLRELAELGFATAQYNLANMYFSGQGVAEDRSQSVRWFTHAAEQGHIEAQVTLGRIHYEGVNVPKDEAQAIKWFTLAYKHGHDDACLILNYIAAEQGDAERQYELGRMFDVEVWDERKFNAFSGFEWYGIFDEVMAIQSCELLAEIWYRRAAEQGHIKAQRELGILYANGGDFVEKDLEVATDWLSRAAECGDADAQYILGQIYTSGEQILNNVLKMDSDGEGVPEDRAQAVKWYRCAAEQGHADAQYKLGLMYLRGDGVPQDDAQAVKWVTCAAVEQGSIPIEDAKHHMRLLIRMAMFHFEACARSSPPPDFSKIMYDELNSIVSGLGEKTRKYFPWLYESALREFRKLAELGDAEAQYVLGRTYALGAGLEKDPTQAVQWFTRAAELGHLKAQYALATNLHAGARNNVQAYAWANLASVNGHEDAANLRDEIATNLSAAQLAEAQQISRELRARIRYSRW